jgi:hypothetical protein
VLGESECVGVGFVGRVAVGVGLPLGVGLPVGVPLSVGVGSYDVAGACCTG